MVLSLPRIHLHQNLGVPVPGWAQSHPSQTPRSPGARVLQPSLPPLLAEPGPPTPPQPQRGHARAAPRMLRAQWGHPAPTEYRCPQGAEQRGLRGARHLGPCKKSGLFNDPTRNLPGGPSTKARVAAPPSLWVKKTQVFRGDPARSGKETAHAPCMAGTMGFIAFCRP